MYDPDNPVQIATAPIRDVGMECFDTQDNNQRAFEQGGSTNSFLSAPDRGSGIFSDSSHRFFGARDHRFVVLFWGSDPGWGGTVLTLQCAHTKTSAILETGELSFFFPGEETRIS